jgi:opacity protein-like surface antigen
MTLSIRLTTAALLVLLAATTARAQSISRGAGTQIGVRGVVEAGSSWLKAKNSLDLVGATTRTPSVAGGIQVVNIWRGLFAQVDMGRSEVTGERVFLHNGIRHPLGLDLKISMIPVDATIGYRFQSRRTRVSPYAGGGIGLLRYRESSQFAEAGDDLNDQFRSWHLVGGIEVPVGAWLAVGGEVHHRGVPNALGMGGTSALTGEHDLGGTSVRLKMSLGR